MTTVIRRAARLAVLYAAATAALALVAAAVLSACGSPQPVSYAPAAYGIPGHCYYVNDPAEALALRAAGLCPRAWTPALMPLAWHQEYWAYYDSPAYYARYVPARERAAYTQREARFGRTYATAITTRSRQATYRTSAGQTVKGTSITAKTRFGPGTSFGQPGQKYGGGNLRNAPKPPAPRPPAYVPRPGKR